MGGLRTFLMEFYNAIRTILRQFYSGLQILRAVFLEFLRTLWAVFVEFLHTLRVAFSPFIEIRDSFLKWASSSLYALLPKTEGKIDENLKQDLHRRLLFTGARFRGFNHSVGTVTELGLFLTIVLFMIGALFAGITTTLSSNLPEIVVQTVNFVMGILVYSSLFMVVIANILLILYLGSLLWYGIRKIRSNITSNSQRESTLPSEDGDDLAKYECRVGESTIEVYMRNFGAVVRSCLYAVLIIVILLYWVGSPLLARATESVANDFQIQKLSRNPISPLIENAVQGVNALFPPDLTYLLSAKGLESLALLTGIVLFFGIFLNWKGVIQHAELSQIDYSPIEPFTIEGEIGRSIRIIRVCLYHIIDGELEEQYRDIRSEITEAGFVVLAASVLSAFYLYVLLNTF